MINPEIGWDFILRGKSIVQLVFGRDPADRNTLYLFQFFKIQKITKNVAFRGYGKVSNAARFAYLDRLILVDTGSEIIGISSESNSQKFQKSIHSVQKGLRCMRYGVERRFSGEYYDTIGEISSHNEIVLDNETSFFRVQNKPASEISR